MITILETAVFQHLRVLLRIVGKPFSTLMTAADLVPIIKRVRAHGDAAPDKRARIAV